MNKTLEIDPEKWIEEYGDYLFSFAISRVKIKDIAEDLVQETLLSAFKNYQKFKGESSFRTWLTAILKNKIFDHYKKSGRFESLTPPDESADEFNNAGIWKIYIPDWGRSPDQTMQDKDFLKTFMQCFEKLKPQSRQLFELKLKEDLQTEEICKVMDISSTNLWVLLHRARLQLRNCLEKNWYNHE